MTHLIVHAGPPAFSRFRLERLREQLSGCDAFAQFVHVVQTNRALDAAELDVMEALLTYGPMSDQPRPVGQHIGTVVPRLGSISPWSSKATDIFHTSGLDPVVRVERGVRWFVDGAAASVLEQLHDRMTERVIDEDAADPFASVFEVAEPQPVVEVDLSGDAGAAIRAADAQLGLALSDDEMEYLIDAYERLDRAPTDVELMMFAQANSEHCRHKIFNATWSVDGVGQSGSLFSRIKNTHRHINGAGVLSAYSDNAAVIEGASGERFLLDPKSARYGYVEEPIHVLMKVETHNHPTAIAPLPGAATGSGGEIRDEGAVGRGSKPKAGLTGFTTSHLNIPGDRQPWELDTGKPDRIVSALSIMLEGPIGAAGFNNEFGRPGLAGYFRTFEMPDPDVAGRVRGYHKPIMVAGGVGNIRRDHVLQEEVPVGSALVVLGGPAMLIGLGGGAASSMASGQSSSDLDFASVQRHNPEMERRCQEVIDACAALGKANPIRLIHDVGAGGLSNALPELVNDADRGGRFDLRRVTSADPGMSPLEIWCNEAQERYVLAIAPEDLDTFVGFCERERCPYAVVGEATSEPRLTVTDPHFDNHPVDLPLSVLFGKPPKTSKAFTSAPRSSKPLDLTGVTVADALARVLRFPAVASKQFLITIGDRSITGLVAQEQLVGPWQVPVADAAVTASGFKGYTGEAMAMGERPPVALLDPAASARLAISEALTNIAAASIPALGRVVLSANWMAACGENAEDRALFEAVRAVGEELCPALGIAIPVGKDSLSMRTRWSAGSAEHEVVSPMTLNVTAFAPVEDIRRTVTPMLQPLPDTSLVLVDLGGGKNRLGGSVLAQCYGQLGAQPADLDDPDTLVRFFAGVQKLLENRIVLAYHDRSDGGLLACVLEMAFAGRCGVDITLPSGDALAQLFAEEPGAVLQVRNHDLPQIVTAFDGLLVDVIGAPRTDARIRVSQGDALHIDAQRGDLQAAWSQTSYQLQRLRDDPQCAEEEFAALKDDDDPGLRPSVLFDLLPRASGAKPKIAILREQGVNGQLEMAAAFDRAGFEAVDVHMTDLLSGRTRLDDHAALVACGGFSYGDVLGGGGGWAKSVLFHERLRSAFVDYFAGDRLVLGVCNGCQMLAQLKSLIPDADHWPHFVRNRSEQFEGRTVLLKLNAVNSVWLDGMAESVVPVAVAHGEGRAEFATADQLAELERSGQLAAQYVDGRHRITQTYPYNPNGAPRGLAAVTAANGRVLAMMPHPERVFRTVQNAVDMPGWQEDGPWFRLFQNARQALN